MAVPLTFGPSSSSESNEHLIAEQRGFMHLGGVTYRVRVVREPIMGRDRACSACMGCFASTLLCFIPFCFPDARRTFCHEPYQGYHEARECVYDRNATDSTADADYDALGFDGRVQDSVIAYLRESGVADQLKEAGEHQYLVVHHPVSHFVGFIFVPNRNIDKARYLLVWDNTSGEPPVSPEASARRFCMYPDLEPSVTELNEAYEWQEETIDDQRMGSLIITGAACYGTKYKRNLKDGNLQIIS